jgi:hypothetical protein
MQGTEKENMNEEDRREKLMNGCKKMDIYLPGAL